MRLSRLILTVLLFFVVAASAQPFDTVRVYFPLDKTQLTDESNHLLDSLIANGRLERGKKITLLGYGDYLGSDAYNKDLSYSRAKNIQDFLVASGFSKQDVVLCLGKGKIARPGTGKTGVLTDRKVDIIFDLRIDTPEIQRITWYLLRLNVNETLPVHNIQFYRGSLRLTPESIPWVNMLVEFMRQNPTYHIRLEGHVCCLLYPQTDEPYDESTLSEKRAHSIADSLVANGIAAERVSYVGLGNTNPIIDPEVTEQDQYLNRRVEVRVLSK